MTLVEISELVGLIFTGIGLILSLIKLIKELKTKNLKVEIEKLMVEAEKQEMSGKQKLNFVILGLYEVYGSGFARLEQQARSYIEECIDFSKKVNGKK